MPCLITFLFFYFLLQLTVEIPEHQQDAILKLLVQQGTCEVVSIRQVQSGEGYILFIMIFLPVLLDFISSFNLHFCILFALIDPGSFL